MKKYLFALLIMSAMFAAMLAAVTKDTISVGDVYPCAAVVTCVNYQTDTVTVTGYSGHQWTFCGVEDWVPGDVCACIMSTNNTTTIFDDEIITARYVCFNTAFY